MDWGWIARLFDSYERHARIAPALLVCFPIVATVGAWLPLTFAGGQLVSASIIAYLAIAILATIVRDAGRRVEPVLFKRWGGVPTTQLLRHRDPVLDTNTKRRFHKFLTTHVPGLKFPSAEQEAQSPAMADEAYASATAWLRERTRDAKKFPLVLAENSGYGFRRNTYGARKLALGLAFTALALNVVGATWAAGMELSKIPEVAIATCIVTFILLMFWVVNVRDPWVREAAFAYAHRLLAACDSSSLASGVEPKPRTAPLRKSSE